MDISPKKTVYIIIPVHNRKNTTLKCLANLQDNNDLSNYHVVIVDDGSTDGTKEAVQQYYPQVKVLVGDGNLWWTGAIQKGMQYAYEQGAGYFIWLNDDCYPRQDAIQTLLKQCQQHSPSIVGGQCLDPDTLEPSYGGITTDKCSIKPKHASNQEVIKCDGLNGNLVCIPREVVEEIGYPDAKQYPHHFGDFIYTKMAQKHGYKIFLVGAAVAICKNDNPYRSWLNPDRPLINLWNSYFDKDSPNYWKLQIFAYKELLGAMGILYCLYLKVIKFWIILLLIRPLSLTVRSQAK